MIIIFSFIQFQSARGIKWLKRHTHLTCGILKLPGAGLEKVCVEGMGRGHSIDGNASPA